MISVIHIFPQQRQSSFCRQIATLPQHFSSGTSMVFNSFIPASAIARNVCTSFFIPGSWQRSSLIECTRVFQPINNHKSSNHLATFLDILPTPNAANEVKNNEFFLKIGLPFSLSINFITTSASESSFLLILIKVSLSLIK